jgi:hypothetical protein
MEKRLYEEGLFLNGVNGFPEEGMKPSLTADLEV